MAGEEEAIAVAVAIEAERNAVMLQNFNLATLSKKL